MKFNQDFSLEKTVEAISSAKLLVEEIKRGEQKDLFRSKLNSLAKTVERASEDLKSLIDNLQEIKSIANEVLSTIHDDLNGNVTPHPAVETSLAVSQDKDQMDRLLPKDNQLAEPLVSEKETLPIIADNKEDLIPPVEAFTKNKLTVKSSETVNISLTVVPKLTSIDEPEKPCVNAAVTSVETGVESDEKPSLSVGDKVEKSRLKEEAKRRAPPPAVAKKRTKEEQSSREKKKKVINLTKNRAKSPIPLDATAAERAKELYQAMQRRFKPVNTDLAV